VSLLHSSSPFSSPADLPQGDRPRRRACRRCARPASGSEGERKRAGEERAARGEGGANGERERERGSTSTADFLPSRPARATDVSATLSVITPVCECVHVRARARVRVLNRDADRRGSVRVALRRVDRRNGEIGETAVSLAAALSRRHFIGGTPI